MELAYTAFVVLSLFALHTSGQETGVNFEVTIMPESRPYTIDMDAHLILTCQYSKEDDIEEPVLRWSFAGAEITETSPQARVYLARFGTNLLLHVPRVQDEDSGTYTCEGTSAGQTSTATVQVLIKRKLEFTSPKEQHGILGEDGLLECKASGKPAPVLQWSFENRTVIHNSDRYIVDDNGLTIKSLTLDDDQTYECLGMLLGVGTAETLYIDYTVAKPPKVRDVLAIQPINPKIGDEVKITCNAEGVPRPRISFKKGQNLVPEAQVNDGVLTIESLKQEDEAEYTCTAENVGGSDFKTTFLDVNIPPEVTITQELTSTDGGDPVEGQEVRVRCSAEGDPRPELKWKKHDMGSYYDDGIQGEEVPLFETDTGPDDVDSSIKKISNTMIFKSINHQDAGKYTCLGVNVVGEVAKETEISIRYPPSFDTDFKQRIFYGWRGARANLTCQTTSNPPPTYKWYTTSAEDPTVKKDQIVTQDVYTVMEQQNWQEYKLSSSSLIVNMDSPDGLYGSYICEASNYVGSGVEGTKQVVLTLQEALAPDQPVVELVSALTTMVTLIFKPPANNGGQEVTSYIYEYYPDGFMEQKVSGSVDISGQSTHAEITDLTMDTEYVITVQAKNNVGAGEAARMTFTTKRKSPPLRLQLTSDKEGADDDTYTITWAKPEDGEDEIIEFIILYTKVQVEDEDSDDWEIGKVLGTEVEEPLLKGSQHLSYTLRNLERDTYYQIRVMARNSQGKSQPSTMLIKTNRGNTEPVEAESGEEGEKEEKDETEAENENTGAEDPAVVEVGESDTNSSRSDTSQEEKGTGSAGMGSGAVIGIILALVVIILLIVLVIYFVTKKKPELVGRLRGRLGGKGGEEERGKADDGKDPAEEEKLIKKEDTVKVENETGEGKPTEGIEEKPEEFEPETKPPAEPVQPTDAEADKPEQPKPAATTEIKITPETPEKPENPTA